MTDTDRSDVRAWARRELRGVCNVILPSFTRDLSGLNEAGVRHDVRRNVELGFRGTLLVSEVATTPDEYVRFVEVAADENQGQMLLIHHASFDTLEQNVHMVQEAERAGANLVLLSYPPSMYPRDEQDVYEYSRRMCDATNLGVILFPVPLWGFERVHPASISVDTLERLVDDCPNVVAVKAEGGLPSIGGFAHAWARLHERVVVTFPIEQHAIGLAALTGMQVIATSNTEYYADRVPTMMRLLAEDRVDDAMEIFWRISPARRANEAAGAIGTANVVQRMVWKYQAWLTGFNGGPLRMPTARIVDAQMRMLRQGLVDSGIPVTEDPDEAFFVGRTTA